MRKTIVAAALTAVMTLGFAGPAAAQTEGEETTQPADDGGNDMGWIGLLGLAGLAGLAGRKRTDNTTGTDYRTTR